MSTQYELNTQVKKAQQLPPFEMQILRIVRYFKQILKHSNNYKITSVSHQYLTVKSYYKILCQNYNDNCDSFIFFIISMYYIEIPDFDEYYSDDSMNEINDIKLRIESRNKNNVFIKLSQSKYKYLLPKFGSAYLSVLIPYQTLPKSNVSIIQHINLQYHQKSLQIRNIREQIINRRGSELICSTNIAREWQRRANFVFSVIWSLIWCV